MLLAVGVDLDRSSRCAEARPVRSAAELLLQHADRALHAALQFVQVICRRCHEPLPRHGL